MDGKAPAVAWGKRLDMALTVFGGVALRLASGGQCEAGDLLGGCVQQPADKVGEICRAIGKGEAVAQASAKSQMSPSSGFSADLVDVKDLLRVA